MWFSISRLVYCHAHRKMVASGNAHAPWFDPQPNGAYAQSTRRAKVPTPRNYLHDILSILRSMLRIDLVLVQPRRGSANPKNMIPFK